MDYGPAILAATQGITAFNTLLPPLSDVRRANPKADLQTKMDIRVGEFAACTITLAVGCLISVLIKHPIPIIIALVICAVMVFVYESVLNVEGQH